MLSLLHVAIAVTVSTISILPFPVISAAGKGSAQDIVASPLGPIDIVGYGEGETLHTDEVLETAEKKPPASYISTILDENRAKSTSPAKSIAGKSQVCVLCFMVHHIFQDRIVVSIDQYGPVIEPKCFCYNTQ